MYKPFIKIKIIKQCKVSSQSHRYDWNAPFSQLSVGRRAVLFYCSDIMTEPNLTRLPGYYISCEAFFHKCFMDILYQDFSRNQISPSRMISRFFFFFTSQNLFEILVPQVAMFAVVGDLLFPRTILFFVQYKTLFSEIAQYLRSGILLKTMKYGGPTQVPVHHMDYQGDIDTKVVLISSVSFQGCYNLRCVSRYQRVIEIVWVRLCIYSH